MDTEETRVELPHVGLDKATSLCLEGARSVPIGMVEGITIDAVFREFDVRISLGFEIVP